LDFLKKKKTDKTYSVDKAEKAIRKVKFIPHILPNLILGKGRVKIYMSLSEFVSSASNGAWRMTWTIF